MEKWFQLAIAQGLRSLLVLGLDRTPAAEVLPETIRVWTDDLWRGRGWTTLIAASRRPWRRRA